MAGDPGQQGDRLRRAAVVAERAEQGGRADIVAAAEGGDGGGVDQAIVAGESAAEVAARRGGDDGIRDERAIAGEDAAPEARSGRGVRLLPAIVLFVTVSVPLV